MEQAIIESIHTVFKGVDQRNWNKVQSVLADHVLVDYTSLNGGAPQEQTPEEIITASRKAEFSLYVYSLTEKSKDLLDDLGKFKIGKMCIYVKKLSDINVETLEKLSKISIAYVNEHHKCACRDNLKSK